MAVNMLEEVENFCKDLSIDVPKYVEDVANPGPKSVDSLVNKAYRYIVNMDYTEYSLNQVNDMIRCTIMVDSYSQVSQLLKQLKEKIPALTGYISESDNGYRGIHLNFTINGFNAEIQIHTPLVSFTNQATEKVYAKWRDFNEAKERENIDKIENTILRQQKMDQLEEKLFEQASDYIKCKKLFSKLNPLTDFEDYQDDISAILTGYQYSKNKSDFIKEQKPNNLDILLSEPMITNNVFDENKAKKLASLLNSSAQDSQKELINIANESRNNMLNTNEKAKLSTKEQFFKDASKYWDSKFYGTLEKVTGVKYKLNYLINPKKFSCLKEVYEYCEIKGFNPLPIEIAFDRFYGDRDNLEKMNPNPVSFSSISSTDLKKMVELFVQVHETYNTIDRNKIEKHPIR